MKKKKDGDGSWWLKGFELVACGCLQGGTYPELMGKEGGGLAKLMETLVAASEDSFSDDEEDGEESKEVGTVCTCRILHVSDVIDIFVAEGDPARSTDRTRCC